MQSNSILFPTSILDSNLTASAVRVLLHLMVTEDEQHISRATSREIAKACNMSLRTVVRAKRELALLDLIEIYYEDNAGKSGIPRHSIRLTFYKT